MRWGRTLLWVYVRIRRRCLGAGTPLVRRKGALLLLDVILLHLLKVGYFPRGLKCSIHSPSVSRWESEVEFCGGLREDRSRMWWTAPSGVTIVLEETAGDRWGLSVNNFRHAMGTERQYCAGFVMHQSKHMTLLSLLYKTINPPWFLLRPSFNVSRRKQYAHWNWWRFYSPSNISGMSPQ